MNTDKNTVIGFVLLAGLFFTYFWYTNKQQGELETYKKHYTDSIAMVKTAEAKAAALKTPIQIDGGVIYLDALGNTVIPEAALEIPAIWPTSKP